MVKYSFIPVCKTFVMHKYMSAADTYTVNINMPVQ